jgi:hypothetical protein
MMLSLFENFLALLLGTSPAELSKRRALQKVKRAIRVSRHRRFYKIRKQDLTPAAAKFFFALYRELSLAQVSWRGASTSAQFRDTVIRHFVEPGVLARLEGLAGEAREAVDKQANARDTARNAREQFKALTQGIDKRIITEINGCYRQALAFEHLAAFDYYLLLRKFGSPLQEHVTTAEPAFRPVKGPAVCGDLKDFLYVSIGIEPKQDWETIFRVFKKWKGGDAMRLDQWYRLLQQLQDANHSAIFELIIRDIEQDPDWTIKPPREGEPALTVWIEARRKELEGTLDQLVRTQWNNQVGRLARQIFGDAPVQGLNYYTKEAGAPFVGRGLPGFIHAEGLNYLAAFMDIFEREIRELCEFLIIRAIWSVMPRNLSDQRTFLTELKQNVADFDAALKPDGARGFKLYQAFARIGRDRLMLRSVGDHLRIINDEARNFLIQGSQTLAAIQKSIEDANKDYTQQPRLLILNWEALEQASPLPLAAWLNAASEKLTAFTAMMSILVEDSAAASNRELPGPA